MLSDAVEQDTQSGARARLRTIRSVHNAVSILRLICESRQALGVTEIAAETGLSKPAVHALLATLKEERLIYQDADSRRYLPGWELAVLSQSVLDGNLFLARGRRELPALADEVGETVFLAAAEESAAVILDSAMGQHPTQLIARPGSRVPLHASAAGKVALAWKGSAVEPHLGDDLEEFTEFTITDRVSLLDEVKAGYGRGYQRVAGEHQRGISSLAVPLLARGTGLIAILAVAMPSESLTEESEPWIVKALQAAARRVTADQST